MRNKLHFIYILGALLYSNEADHLLLTKIVTQPNAAESFSIYNPTDTPIDLTHYYICDNEKYYTMQTEGNMSPASNSNGLTTSGFSAQFPARTIDPGDTLMIVLNENYSEFYGENFYPDLMMFGDSDSSMLQTESGSFGILQNKIEEASELLILFYWDGNGEILVRDVDYFLWGSYQTPINKTDISAYSDDTPIDNQFYFMEDATEYYAYSRIGSDEVDETASGGNGITGHDVTSEKFRQSWKVIPHPHFIGCTDPKAENFSPIAVFSDCICEYNYSRLRVCTYNIWNFDSDSNDRILTFQKILGELCADILTVQELSSTMGAELFYDEIISQVDPQYLASPISYHPWFFNMLYYKTPLNLVSASTISTDVRFIHEFILSIENDTFTIYSVHLKAGQGFDENINVDNEQERYDEIQRLYQNVNNQYPYMVMGDFNIYTSNEPTFQFLLNEMSLIDPINQIGDWNNNANYKSIHTQSTRSTSIGYYDAGGGLDDRFDMILVSEGISVIENTYSAFGNDANHFNQSINNGTNGAVRQDMADALYYASDHLPVCVDISFTDISLSGCPDTAACNYDETVNIDNGSCEYPADGIDCAGNVLSFYSGIMPNKYSIYNIYPNPFNPITHITYGLPENIKVQIAVYDLSGKQIELLIDEYQIQGYYLITWNADNHPSGMYFVAMIASEYVNTQKLMLIK